MRSRAGQHLVVTGVGIHPRVVDGRRHHAKVDTHVPSRRLGKPARKVQARYDQRVAAHAVTVRWCELNHANPLSFRKPGSRNPAKLRNR